MPNIDIETLLSLTGQPAAQVPIIGFIGNLIIASLLSMVLADIYIRYGKSLANRKTLASNFMLITITTMFIITVVKSSLALSLGLVGALSIVRFRTAIKEPEELSYLFLTIAIGLGLGADQVVVTLVTFVFIILIIWLTSLIAKPKDNSQMFLTVSGKLTKDVSLQSIVTLLKKHSQSALLKRHDESAGNFEGIFAVHFEDFNNLEDLRQALNKLDPDIKFTFIENK